MGGGGNGGVLRSGWVGGWVIGTWEGVGVCACVRVCVCACELLSCERVCV
jgi:hypothetical protein